MFELIYTSTSAGLIPGRSGFASVAWTEGIPVNLIAPVEGLSAYKPVFSAHHPDAAKNPVCFSYVRLRYGSYLLRVVSRIGFAGLDYTGRSNKIAHHLVFDNAAELAALPGGAVALAREEHNFETAWESPARTLPPRGRLRGHAPGSGIASAWQRLAGDAGWAGVVAEQFLHEPDGGFYLEFPLAVGANELLELAAEVTRLLPEERLDEFTFSTYFAQAPIGCECFLRAVLSDSPTLATIRRFHPALIVSLTSPGPVPATLAAGPLVAMARTGAPVKPEPETTTELPQQSAMEPDTDTSQAPLPAEPAPGNYVPPVESRHSWLQSMEDKKAAADAVAAEHTARSRRRMFFLLAVFIPAALIVAAIGTECRKPVPRNVPRIEPETAMQPLPPPPLPVRPPEPVPEPVSEPQTVPVVKKPGVRPLTASEALTLYRHWRNTVQSGTIPLPEALTPATVLVAEINGSGRIPLSKLSPEERAGFLKITVNPPRVELLPARCEQSSPEVAATYLPDTAAPPQSRLILELRPRALNIALPTTRELPRLDNIVTLIFSDDRNQVVWQPVFLSSYLPVLTPGRIRIDEKWNPTFSPSPDEIAFRTQIDTRIGNHAPGSFTNLPLRLQVEAWNRLIAEMREAYERSAEASTRMKLQQNEFVTPPTPEQSAAKLKALDELSRNDANPDRSLTQFSAQARALYAMAFSLAADGQDGAARNLLNQLKSAVTGFMNQAYARKWDIEPLRAVQKELNSFDQKVREWKAKVTEANAADAAVRAAVAAVVGQAAEIRAFLAGITPELASFFNPELNGRQPIGNSAEQRAAFSRMIPITHNATEKK